MTERLQVVQLLIQFPEDLDDISIQLSKFCFDYDGEPVILKLKDVTRALNLYLDGVKTEEEIENWANLLEGREDIEFLEDEEEELDEVMHKLANPYLQGPLTFEYCKEFVSKHE